MITFRKYINLIFPLLLGILYSISLFSCNDGDLRNDIDEIKKRVTTLEDAVKSLEVAFNAGKTITDVSSAQSGKGWTIGFNDGTSITLNHGENGQDGLNGQDGQNGVTPLIIIDDDGHWSVSYDGGSNFSKILDKNGNVISPFGTRGNDGVNGKDGADGNDGVDGRNGLCVRVATNEAGYYVFETYDPENPSATVESIETPYSSEPGAFISSIVKDSFNDVITLILADGQTFSFNLDISFPTGIVALNDSIILHPGKSFVLQFRINPSNAKIDLDADCEQPQIQLDLISSRSTYVTEPANYRIVSIDYAFNTDGSVKMGQYEATVIDLEQEEEYDEKVVLVVNSANGNGEPLQLSSSLIKVKGSLLQPELTQFFVEKNEVIPADDNDLYVQIPYTANLSRLSCNFNFIGDSIVINGTKANDNTATIDMAQGPATIEVHSYRLQSSYRLIPYFSQLPVVYVSTPSEITSKLEWTDACSIDIFDRLDASHEVSLEKVQIKGRGNTTWAQPKKPYAIKLDKKNDFLGMPKHKRWVLLANYMDPSALRNELAFDMGRISNLDYTPRTRFVELIYNGTYNGLYQVTEQLKIDDNRVNVGDDGFLMEIDARAGQDPDDIYFKISGISYPIVIKDPDVVEGDVNYEFLRNYLTLTGNAITAIKEGEENTLYRDYIDLESFVDWYLINEISRNNDAIFYSSCYMNLSRNGKLKMGPLWDYDLAFGNNSANDSKNPEGFWIKTQVNWYRCLFRDDIFVNAVKQRFQYFYDSKEALYSQMRENAAFLSDPVAGNFTKWHIYFSGDTENVKAGYTQRVESVISWLDTRFEWLKIQYEQL